MEMKVGKHIQSSFSKYKNNADPVAANAKAKSTNSSMNVDTFSLSASSSPEPKWMEIYRQTAELRKGIADGTIIKVEHDLVATDDFEKRTKLAFGFINASISSKSQYISMKLKEAGVPEDVTFEFDYNSDTHEILLTEISDETYRDAVQSVLKDVGSMDTIAYGSRVLNGFISSVYYSRIAKELKSCFGQDISELYIDENGNIGGANAKLQKALADEKNTENFDAEKKYGFSVNQIEAMLKRLISDENITPNISHMAYDRDGLYTHDGDIHLGKDIDPALFEDRSFLARAAFSLKIIFKGDYDYWLSNEELFK